MKQFNCEICGTPFSLRKWSKDTVFVCSEACREIRRQRRRKRVTAPCKICGKTVTLEGKKLSAARNDGVLCSRECWLEIRRRARAKAAPKINAYMRTTHAKFMRENNPMKRPAVREKVSKTLKEIGWKPKIRGGNGMLTKPQIALAARLGWPVEYPVLTAAVHTAHCLKLDIANPDLKIGIEVDGGSHCALRIRKQDREKERVLSELGWTVLRFSNKQVMEHLEDCVQTVLSTTSRLTKTTTTSLTAS